MKRIVVLAAIALFLTTVSSPSSATPTKQDYSEDLRPGYSSGGDDDEPAVSLTKRTERISLGPYRVQSNPSVRATDQSTRSRLIRLLTSLRNGSRFLNWTR